MKRLAALLLALSLSAGTLGAQLNPDRLWERLQARHPWLYQLDNRPWKTWIAHSVITVIGGYTIGALTPLDAKTGLRLMVGMYLVREVWGVAVDGNRKYLDATMDVVAPAITAEFLIRF